MLQLSALYLLFLPPPSLSIDAETANDVVVYDYIVDEPSLSTELPGKQNPLDHSYIAYSFSLLLALEFATAIVLSFSDAQPVYCSFC